MIKAGTIDAGRGIGSCRRSTGRRCILTEAQSKTATTYLAANWAKAIG